jgi:PAS domain S-box-containing protein
MCIEDDRGVARLFQRHLERAGYAVDLAYDGQEGLARLEAGSYDVAIIDHLMPERTGLEVIRTLAERETLPPTIMVTGAGDEETAVEAMKLGADDYLVKDVDGGYLSLLPAIIDRVLHQRRIAQERREALDALRESERWYRTLVETTGDVILLHDEEGRITFMNQAGLDFSGFAQQELLGQSVAGFLPPDEHASLFRRRKERLAGNRDELLYETAFVDRAGRRLEISVRATPIFEGETYRGSLIVARDITELNQMKEQLQRKERLASLGQLASGIAHSFRNILNTIILYAELDLRKADLPADVASNLRTILQESHRASDLVQQILDFSSRAMIHREPVDLSALLRDLVADLRSTMPKEIALKLSCEPGADGGTLTASVDAARLRQALTNLAINARDAMPRGGELRFGLSCTRMGPDETLPTGFPSSLSSPARTGQTTGGQGTCPDPVEWICLTVSDTGTGMTEETRSQLFTPFFTTKDVDQGTGLGLAQVYGIVRQHGGAIDVETEPGEGTTFFLYLPAHRRRDRGRIDSEKPSAEKRDSGEPGTILLVTDQEELRRVGESALESLGYRVVVAGNEREALALCQSPRWSARDSARVAVALIDLDAPTIETATLVSDLRRARPTIRALALTDRSLEEGGEDLLSEDDFAGVVHRPLEPAALSAALRQTLNETWCA